MILSRDGGKEERKKFANSLNLRRARSDSARLLLASTSALLNQDVGHLAHEAASSRRYEAVPVDAAQRFAVACGVAAAVADACGPVRTHPACPAGAEAQARVRDEIGRASCRERVS